MKNQIHCDQYCQTIFAEEFTKILYIVEEKKTLVQERKIVFNGFYVLLSI